MPYPPPPGPPDVGEFQAIGKLPAPELPDVTGHGGEFLETDGIVPQWQPVSGVLPDPAGHAGEFLTTPDGVTVGWSVVSALPDMSGHAGEFLTTDGSVASWAPGGGGGGITTIGALTTAAADAAIISGGDTLQLGEADATHPGVLSTGGQAIGGIKLFRDGAAVTTFDIRNYGAVPNDETVDVAPAFYAALKAANQTQNDGSGLTYGRIYFPTGRWYTSAPLCVPEGIDICGDSPTLTMIYGGTGGPTIRTGNVQGFSGVIVYGCPPFNPTTYASTPNSIPTFGTALATGPGGSLPFPSAYSFNNTCLMQYFLHDSYPWSIWLGTEVSTLSFGIQFFFKVTIPPDGNHPAGGLIGSMGLRLYSDVRSGTDIQASYDQAFSCYLTGVGSDWKLCASLTTAPAWTNGFNMPSVRDPGKHYWCHYRYVKHSSLRGIVIQWQLF